MQNLILQIKPYPRKFFEYILGDNRDQANIRSSLRAETEGSKVTPLDEEL